MKTFTDILWLILFLGTTLTMSIVMGEGMIRVFTGTPTSVFQGEWFVWIASHLWHFLSIWIACVIYKLIKLLYLVQ